MAKPYTEYVGRSTTPLRAILALFIANLAVPLAIAGTIFVPAWLTGNADWDTWSANARQFLSVWMLGAVFAAPFIWIVGGIVWMFAHGTRQNGPAMALIAGGGATLVVATLGTAVSTAGSVPSLSGFIGLIVFLVFISLFGAFGGAVVWIIAYKARPVRRSCDTLPL